MNSQDPGKVYLLGLTDPSSFMLMWPIDPKSHSPSIQHLLAGWVLEFIVNLLLNAHVDCPATFRRVLQVFNNRVIVFLPTIHISGAEKASHIVSADG